jgi:hypothetical protein
MFHSMKIAFLVPTLDFGRDGIADYTFRLAEQCRTLGHKTQLLAVGRNNWLTNPRKLKHRLAKVQQQIIDFSPDVISWQFDGRMFHPQAVFPRWVIPDWSKLCKKVHLMAHETWEGDEVGARLRRRLKGVIQKYSFQQVLELVAPDIVHTSNSVYLEHFQGVGISARVLPLFSSFPVALDSSTRTAYDASVWEFVFFGGFRDHWNPSEFILSLKGIDREIIIHHVGMHNSPEILNSLRDACKGWAEFIEHGVQSDRRVSEILLRCHFGVSIYNLLLLEKSSVYATFLDHGLPVIVPRLDLAATSKGFVADTPAAVILPQGLLGRLENQRSMAVRDSLETTTKQFLQDLNGYYD